LQLEDTSEFDPLGIFEGRVITDALAAIFKDPSRLGLISKPDKNP